VDQHLDDAEMAPRRLGLEAESLGPQRMIESARSEKIPMVVARMIASEIAKRNLSPGSPLPTEQLMATEFGVGRPSVREALRLLETQGLVVIRPGQGGGPVVGKPSAREFGRTVSLFLQVQRVTLRDALEAAIHLGGLYAGMAAAAVANGDDELVPELVEASKVEVPESESDDAFLYAGRGFHDVVRRMAKNDTLALMLSGLGYIYSVRVRQAHQGHWDVAERLRTRKEHEKIASAIALGAVGKAHQLHVAHAKKELEYIEKAQPGLLDEIIHWG
jgi:GntR family transcriptional regulator, transcriptional repressor for pyruvate dehydrogenase complex